MQLYSINKESVLTAEIFHTLNIIINHQSFNSSTNSSAVYKVMFPDSQIAQNFNCGSTKVKYLSEFGLAPYYEQKLLTKLDEVPYYSLLFDESLNRQTKNEQMDFKCHIWTQISTRLLTITSHLNLLDMLQPMIYFDAFEMPLQI